MSRTSCEEHPQEPPLIWEIRAGIPQPVRVALDIAPNLDLSSPGVLDSSAVALFYCIFFPQIDDDDDQHQLYDANRDLDRSTGSNRGGTVIVF